MLKTRSIIGSIILLTKKLQTAKNLAIIVEEIMNYDRFVKLRFRI